MTYEGEKKAHRETTSGTLKMVFINEVKSSYELNRIGVILSEHYLKVDASLL